MFHFGLMLLLSSTAAPQQCVQTHGTQNELHAQQFLYLVHSFRPRCQVSQQPDKRAYGSNYST